MLKANEEVIEIMQENEEIKEAKEEGIKEGEKKAKLEDAKRMLEEEITLEQIIRITGLTKEEIMKDIARK